MIEGTVEQIVKVTAPKISIFYRIILVIACLLAATTIVQTGWLGVIVLVIFIFLRCLYLNIITLNMNIHMLTEASL